MRGGLGSLLGGGRERVHRLLEGRDGGLVRTKTERGKEGRLTSTVVES